MQDRQDGPGGPNTDLSFTSAARRRFHSANRDRKCPDPSRPFSRRAMLRATAWGAALGASAALPYMEVPVAAADPQLVFGPQDGKLVNAATQLPCIVCRSLTLIAC